MPSSVQLAVIIFGLVVLYFTVGTLLNGGKDDTAAEVVERPLFTVLVLDAKLSDNATEVPLTGRTEAGARIVIRAETPGQVARVVADGARVKRGDVVCALDTDSRRAVLAEAQAGAAKARADFEAAQRLFDEGFTAEAGLKTARAALDGARARESQARLDLQNVRLTAPFDGVVADVLVDPGDVLGVGGGCAVLANLDQVIIAGGVPAREASGISVGDSANVNVGGRPISGQVKFVADVADDTTRTFRVEIGLPDDAGLAAGQGASAIIATGAAAAVVIPRNALVFDDSGKLGVRIVTDVTDAGVGTVDFRATEIAGENGDGVAVTGIPASTAVIVRGQEFVSVGTKVAVERAVGPIKG